MARDPWTDPDPQPGDFDAELETISEENLEFVEAGSGAKLTVIADYRLPLIKVSGALEGNYVVLLEYADGALRIAPKQRGPLPTVVALKQTSSVAPAQWEGMLDDGRAFYAHYRRGQLSVGLGSDRDEAIRNSFPADALLIKELGPELDGAMDLMQLRAHLYGLLEFPDDLFADGEQSEKATSPNPNDKARPSVTEIDKPDRIATTERIGSGIREIDIGDWTCFSCGGALTQAHEGDYFHTADDSTCFDPIPVPTSLVKLSSAEMTGTEAKLRGAQQAHGGRD